MEKSSSNYGGEKMNLLDKALDSAKRVDFKIYLDEQIIAKYNSVRPREHLRSLGLKKVLFDPVWNKENADVLDIKMFLRRSKKAN